MIPLHDDNPTELAPIVTVGLIVLCVAAFFWELSLPPAKQSYVIAFSVIPSALLGHQSLPQDIGLVSPYVTVVTSMFLHGGWMHLIGNMLYLWIFGNNVEDAMGHSRFVFFYLLCGVAAAYAHAIPNATSAVPTLGASGAISGVLGAYLLLYPHARVMVFIPLGFLSRVVYLPAVFVLGFWFLLQLLGTGTRAPGGGGVAWGAHIGGFVAGMLLIPLFKRRSVRLFSPGHRQGR